MKKTLVLGASPNPERYAYRAVSKLKYAGHEVIPMGIKEGSIEGISIVTESCFYENLDTITIYLNAARQKAYYEYILSLKPRRIIFNPGSENPELMMLADAAGIATMAACTLVLLSIGDY